VQLEGLAQLKKSTSSGLESATLRLIAYFLNQLRYRVRGHFSGKINENQENFNHHIG
jgi:hypothetical protein